MLGQGAPSLVVDVLLADLFTSTSTDRHGHRLSDPRVVWDPSAGRFFVSAVDATTGEALVEVSNPDDPTRAQWIETLPTSGCSDQPRLAISDTVVVLTDSVFDSCASGPGQFVGSELWVMSKADLISGASAVHSARFGPNPFFFKLTPAQPISGGSTVWLVALAPTGNAVMLWSVSDVPSSGTLPGTPVPIASVNPAPDPAQQGSSLTVDGGDWRVQDAFFDGTLIHATSTSACSASSNAPVQSCIRYLEIDPASMSLVRQSTVFSSDGRDFIYPAVRTDAAGNVIVAFGYSSANDYPSLGYTISPTGATSFTDWYTVSTGEGPVTGGRYGDYFGITRDANDPNLLWLAGEVMGADGWKSVVAAVRANPIPPKIRYAQTPQEIAQSSADLTASVDPAGARTTYHFEYGTTTSYGSQTTDQTADPAAGEQPVDAIIDRLAAATTYHYRAVATNSAGTTYGDDQTFTTASPPPPAPVTKPTPKTKPNNVPFLIPPRLTYPARPATRISATVLLLRATARAGSGATTYTFQIGLTPRYGRALRAHVGASGLLYTRAAGLKPHATYHFRIIARQSRTITVGRDITVRLR